MPTEMVCDCCSETPVVRVVPVPEMVLDLPDALHAFDSVLALCATCEDMWLRRERDELVLRSFEAWRAAGGEATSDADVLAMIRAVHAVLWLARQDRDDPQRN